MKKKLYAGDAGSGLTAPAETHDSPTEENGAVRQLTLMILWFMLGLVTPRACVYGSMAPFGISFAAAAPGIGAAAAYIAVFIGYLIPGGAAIPIKYLAALVVVAGIKWAMSGIRSLSAHPAFAPVISFISVEFVGFALLLVNGPDAYAMLLTVAEGLLAAGSAYFFSISVGLVTGGRLHGALTAQEQSSAVMTVAIILMAAASFNINGISPGRIAAGAAVLLLAGCGREQGGSIAGVVLGVTLALSSPSDLHMAAALALGGLTAGVFARIGKFASAGAFIVCYLIVSINTGDSLVIIAGIYEVLAASIIYVALPTSLNRFINRFFVHANDIPAVEGLRRSVVMRLDHAAAAMTEVAEAVDTVSGKLSEIGAPDLGTVYRSVSDDVCRVCGMRMVCWERAFNDTMSAFNDLTPVLRRYGKVEPEQVGKYLSAKCSRLEDVLDKINAGYAAFTVREGAFRRLGEIRSVVTDQFSGMSEMLSELSADFAKTERVDTEAALRVIAVCEEFGLLVRDAVCLIGQGGYMTVEVVAVDEGVRLSRDKWMSAMGDACGRELAAPSVVRYDNHIKITLTEKPVYSVRMGNAQLRCDGESLCGDAWDSFSDNTGKWYAILSDGMGSGGRAAVDGAMAVGLTERLLRAGFGHESTLRLVNSALMVKSGDESLSTLDVAEIDLYNGRLICRKAGASPTLLCSKGRVSRIDKASLPMGILREIKSEMTEDALAAGDILLMFSDGAMTGGLEWIEEKLRSFDPDTGTVKQLAEDIAVSARKRQEVRQDDVTVMAIQIQRELKI